jgi:hypothetical protein
MRRILHIAAGMCLVMLSAAPAWAQFGVQVGGNVSYLTVPEGTDRQMGPGGLVGIYVNLPLFATMKLQPEVQFQRRMSKVTFGTGSTDVELDYATASLLVNMPIFGLYITEGLSAHFPVKGTYETAGQKRDVTDDLTSPDLSIVIGVGVQVGRVGIEGRWDSGLKEVQKRLGPGEFVTRNRAISALASIRLF